VFDITLQQKDIWCIAQEDSLLAVLLDNEAPAGLVQVRDGDQSWKPPFMALKRSLFSGIMVATGYKEGHKEI
jgi:hypothetical protein